MFRKGEEIHETATETRAGSNVKGMPFVLGGSLALVVLAFAVILTTGAL